MNSNQHFTFSYVFTLEGQQNIFIYWDYLAFNFGNIRIKIYR